MSHRVTSVLVAAFVIVAAVAMFFSGVSPVVASNDSTPVEGTVELDGNSQETEFETGEEDTLQVFVSNDGEVLTDGTHPQEVRDRATEARSTDLNITDTNDAPIEVRSGEQSIGTIDSDETVTETFDIFVESDAEPGEYDIELTADYKNVTVTDYEEGVGDALEIEEETTNESARFEVTITIADEARFDIESVSHSVMIDDSGDFSLEVTNTGTLDINETVVTVQSSDQDIFFGTGGQTAERAVGEWEAGETKSLTYRAGTSAEAVTEAYPIDVTFEYIDPDGEDATQTEQTAFTPRAGQVFTVGNISHNIVIGDAGILELELENHGPENLTNASVSIDTNDPALTFEDADGGSTTTQTFIGDWAVNDNQSLSLLVGASDEAVQRDYAVDVTVSARDTDDNELNDRTREFGLHPLPPQRYSIENVSHTVQINDNGVLEVEMKNHGPINVTDATVTLGTNDPAIVFGSGGVGDTVQIQDMAFETGDGGSLNSEAFVGDWKTGETVTLRYPAGATDDALVRNYTIDATVEARNEDDRSLNPRERQFGFSPHPEQSFSIDNADNVLRVGEDGDIVGNITNDGEKPVKSVVVRFTSELQNVFPRDTEYAIGDLEPGETETFRFRVELTNEAEPVPRLFEFETRYRNHEGEVRLYDSQDLVVDVEEQRDVFDVDAINAEFEAGESGAVEVELENNQDETLENIRVKAFTDSPLVSDDDEAFVSAIEPGESTTVVFDLRVDSDAMAKSYPISLDFRYDDASGDTQLSGTYRVPITVTEPPETGPPLYVFAGIGLVLFSLLFYFRKELWELGGELGGRVQRT